MSWVASSLLATVPLSVIVSPANTAVADTGRPSGSGDGWLGIDSGDAGPDPSAAWAAVVDVLSGGVVDVVAGGSVVDVVVAGGSVDVVVVGGSVVVVVVVVGGSVVVVVVGCSVVVVVVVVVVDVVVPFGFVR